MEGIVGKKIGMTRVFDQEGQAIAVTVVEAGPCPVVQVKTKEREGYDAIQLGFGEKRKRVVSANTALVPARKPSTTPPRIGWYLAVKRSPPSVRL